MKKSSGNFWRASAQWVDLLHRGPGKVKNRYYKKPLLLTMITPNFIGNINIDIFFHSDICRLRNCNFENIKIIENYKKNLLCFIYHPVVWSNSNICPKIPGILYPDFSRIFRIRFFPGKKQCAVLRAVRLSAILTVLSPITMASVLLLPGRSWQI